MGRLLRATAVRLIVVWSLALWVVDAAAKKKEETPLATLNVLVIRDENGKPVRNASVVLHPVDEEGNQTRGGLELKTSPEGKASYEGVPYGKLRVQVLAPGFQTYGDDYNIAQPALSITIKLKRPGGQFSIYDSAPETKDKPGVQERKPQN